ncbi:MAG: hypothetical protein K2J30_02340, partial [Clostridia bacterium]|nr:hypothetical protein [Clostridia bacterium]
YRAHACGNGLDEYQPYRKKCGQVQIYVKVSLKNHNDLVYDFVYEMKAFELDFDIVLKRKPDASSAAQTLVKGSTGYSEAYNGQAITAEISYKWGTGSNAKPSTFDGDTTKPTVVYYYKGNNNDTTYGKAGNTEHPDESLTIVTPPATPAPAGLGNKTAPSAGGEYVVTLRDEGTTHNYKFKSGTATTEVFKITKQEVTAPTDPTGTYYYDTNIKEIAIPGFNATSMKFVEDTTNGYVEDKSTAGNTDPDASNGEKLTFSAVTKGVRVKNAGEYTIKFEVSDTNSYVWAGDSATTREVKIVVKGAPVYIEWDNDLTETTASERWKWELGTTGNITYTLKFSNNGGAAYNSDGTNPDDVK